MFNKLVEISDIEGIIIIVKDIDNIIFLLDNALGSVELYEGIDALTTYLGFGFTLKELTELEILEQYNNITIYFIEA